ncbi:hypothetical protein [Nesterenkonia lutea]|uniref:Hydroxymethylpyrimidine pyrophosphatase-like HAD family hydrolase n=1 Tax=Nesterenkonia lutea TaxID=272919 RepID=A0ABR9JG68_9MICC|nr:hypothetical protein [Nesterenkonia lutea]MBE1524924.1 hydroxymethylpyrimidine pyrophosphatase-like HAD family hydrolase [Nesterenkonia lutea]
MTSTAETAVFNPAPPFGLLLDVDGPIASPVSRTVAIESIAQDLAALANQGIPVIFNTGRSDDFIARQVIPPMRAAGLLPDTPVFTVAEKGAVWAEVTPEGLGEIHIDEDLKLPTELSDEVRDLVAERFSEHMFFDETKRAMVSVEQSTEVENKDYLEAQKEFDAAIPGLLQKHGLEHVRIDPTIISTDVEHERVGKDLGAERSLTLLEARGVTAQSWFTMGDSRTDYAMAGWLHERGLPVTHVDVRPEDGIPETDYEVLTSESGAIHDEAGAEFLTRWAADPENTRAGRRD